MHPAASSSAQDDASDAQRMLEPSEPSLQLDLDDPELEVPMEEPDMLDRGDDGSSRSHAALSGEDEGLGDSRMTESTERMLSVFLLPAPEFESLLAVRPGVSPPECV